MEGIQPSAVRDELGPVLAKHLEMAQASYAWPLVLGVLKRFAVLFPLLCLARLGGSRVVATDAVALRKD